MEAEDWKIRLENATQHKRPSIHRLSIVIQPEIENDQIDQVDERKKSSLLLSNRRESQILKQEEEDLVLGEWRKRKM